MRKGEGDEEDTAFRSRCFKKPLTSDGNQYKQWSRDSKEICPDTENETEREGEKNNESKERT